MLDLSVVQRGRINEWNAEPVGLGSKGAIIVKKDGDEGVQYVEIASDGTFKDTVFNEDSETAKAFRESRAGEAKRTRTLDFPAEGAAITEPARYGFKTDQIIAIKNTVAKDCSNAELVMYLEVAARYGLDPFAKQIYAAKIKGAVQIIVSRDGLLAHAHKQDSFIQMDGDVVCANDDFTNVFEDGKRKIRHAYGTKVDPGASDPDQGPGEGRGPIIGAWARVVRRSHGETYFFAPMSEYMQDRDGPWKKTPSAMILKCAETYALRKAFSISGVVGEDEIEKDRKRLTDVEGQRSANPGLESVERGPYILELAALANQLEANSYLPGKLTALAHDPDALVEELCAFIVEKGGTVPDEPIEGEAEEITEPVAAAA